MQDRAKGRRRIERSAGAIRECKPASSSDVGRSGPSHADIRNSRECDGRRQPPPAIAIGRHLGEISSGRHWVAGDGRRDPGAQRDLSRTTPIGIVTHSRACADSPAAQIPRKTSGVKGGVVGRPVPIQSVALRFVVGIRNNVTAVEASNPPTTTHDERIEEALELSGHQYVSARTIMMRKSRCEACCSQ